MDSELNSNRCTKLKARSNWEECKYDMEVMLGAAGALGLVGGNEKQPELGNDATAARRRN